MLLVWNGAGFLCLWVGMCVFLGMQACLNLDTYVQRSEVNDSVFLSHAPSQFLRQGLRVYLKLSDLARQAHQWTLGNLCLLALKLQALTCHWTGIFIGVSGIEFSSQCFHGKPFYWLSPIPRCSFGVLLKSIGRWNSKTSLIPWSLHFNVTQQ